MKKLLLSTLIVSQLLSFEGHATDLEIEARMTKSRASTSEKNSQIFSAYEFVSTQQTINLDFIEKYKDYSTIRLQLPSNNAMDLEKIGAYLAPLVVKGSGLNFETLDLSFNNWQSSQMIEFLEGLTTSQKIEQEKISGPSYTGTFEEYKEEQNTFFDMSKLFATFSGQSNADVPSLSDDQIAEKYKKESQPVFKEKTVTVDHDVTLKNINLSHNLIFEDANFKQEGEDKKTNMRLLLDILVNHEFESINLSHNFKDFWALNSDNPDMIIAGVLLGIDNEIRKTGYPANIDSVSRDNNHFYTFVKALRDSVEKYKGTTTNFRTNEQKLNLKTLDLSFNNIQNLWQDTRRYGNDYLDMLSENSSIEILDLSNNPLSNYQIERYDYKIKSIGKILISSHTLSEDLKAKLSDPSLQSKWVIKD